MALTATVLSTQYFGSVKLVTIKVLGDASYPTGGYPVTPALFNLLAFAPSSDAIGPLVNAFGTYSIEGDIQGSVFLGINPAAGANQGNLQYFVTTTGVEVAATTNETANGGILSAYGT